MGALRAGPPSGFPRRIRCLEPSRHALECRRSASRSQQPTATPWPEATRWRRFRTSRAPQVTAKHGRPRRFRAWSARACPGPRPGCHHPSRPTPGRRLSNPTGGRTIEPVKHRCRHRPHLQRVDRRATDRLHDLLGAPALCSRRPAPQSQRSGGGSALASDPSDPDANRRVTASPPWAISGRSVLLLLRTHPVDSGAMFRGT